MALEKQRMYRKNIDGTKDLIYRETSSDLVKHGDTDLNTKINGIDSSLADITNEKVDKLNGIPQDVNGHGINIAKPNLNNINYENLVIDVEKYGILWNNGTVNGKDLRITKCNIKSDKADGIEINTFGDLNTLFRNVIVTDNFIRTGDVSATNSSGFGIGIAEGQNVIIANNIIDNSSREGIHLEGRVRNGIVKGNIIDNCIGDGIVLYGDLNHQSEVEHSLISENAIRSKNKVGNGINITYSSSTTFGIANLSNNKVYGFNNGIYSSTSFNVNNTLIRDCNTALRLYKADNKIKGIFKTINTPNIVTIESGRTTYPCAIDGFITDDTLNIDTMISKPTNTNLLMKYMSYNVALGDKDTSNYCITNISKVPKYFKGILTLTTQNGGNYANYILNVELLNGVLTKTDIVRECNGSYGNITLSLVGGYLEAKFINTLSTTNQKIIVEFDGNVVF